MSHHLTPRQCHEKTHKTNIIPFKILYDNLYPENKINNMDVSVLNIEEKNIYKK
jgi:hypothetical protein